MQDSHTRLILSSSPNTQVLASFLLLQNRKKKQISSQVKVKKTAFTSIEKLFDNLCKIMLPIPFLLLGMYFISHMILALHLLVSQSLLSGEMYQKNNI